VDTTTKQLLSDCVNNTQLLYPVLCVKVLIVLLTVYTTFIDGTTVVINHLFYIGLEVLTAVVMRSSIVWDMTLCSSVKVIRRFEGTSCAWYLLHVAFLLSLFFYPED
jgi:hypothetical protein